MRSKVWKDLAMIQISDFLGLGKLKHSHDKKAIRNALLLLITYLAVGAARIKKGMARRLNTEIPEKILWAPVSTLAPIFKTGKIAQIEETANATAIGTPAISMTASNTNIISPQSPAIVILSPPRLL